MLTNGYQVAVIENHNNWQGTDPWTNSYSLARISFWGDNGNPTSHADGVGYLRGGYAIPNSLFGYYSSWYNGRYPILSDFTIQMTATNVGLTYTIHVIVTKVGSPTNTNMKLISSLTQSNNPRSWGGGLTTVDHCNRLMAPDANGTVVDFSSGNTQSYDLTYTIDAGWPLADLQVVTFIQDYDTKEVLQGTFAPLESVGVNETINNNYNLNVYPNPVNKEATIAFDLKETSTAVLNIYDMIGKMVYSKNLGTVNPGVNFVDFDGSKLESGMYIIKLIVNNQTITKKITLNK